MDMDNARGRMSDRLAGKVAIVTGAGTGIGRAIARRFALEGAKVSMCGRTRSTLDESAQQIEAQGGQALVTVCDVSDAEAVQAMVARTLDSYGRIDVLVNNAGVRASIGTILELDPAEWERTFEIDAKGSWLCSKYVIPTMQSAGGGSIIMVSSISAHIGQTRQGAYNAAKGAQELLMKCMALDFAPDHIRVNSICPAWVLTEMNREQLARMQASPDEKFPPGLSYRDVLRLHPLGRIGTPDDVAWAAVYLASNESAWVTGTSLFVDGGFTCQ
jgi:NAD(P)-dependent dehydrogenase (short-subunit alcohol dehydrogenase family)